MSYHFLDIGGENNSYIFQTDHQIIYEVKFKKSDYLLLPASSKLKDLIFEFVIDILENTNQTKIPIDNKIGLTIAQIFNDFFDKNSNTVSIFICDSSDAKQEIRMKKFNQWYYKFQDSSFIKIDEILIDKKKIRYPISMILKTSNPYRIAILEAFMDITKLQNSDK
jgi:hypothetical protein